MPLPYQATAQYYLNNGQQGGQGTVVIVMATRLPHRGYDLTDTAKVHLSYICHATSPEAHLLETLTCTD